jgi:hypothetical protein
MLLLRKIAVLEETRRADPIYRRLRSDLEEAQRALSRAQEVSDRREREHASALSALQRASARNYQDAECAFAELRAVRAALAETPLSLFRASAETLRALREEAEDQVRVLIDELDFAGQQMAGEISSLRAQLAEALDSAEHDEARRRERIEILEACFLTPARLARMNGTPAPAENLPQVFYWTPIGDPGKAVSYHISRAADQHATA